MRFINTLYRDFPFIILPVFDPYNHGVFRQFISRVLRPFHNRNGVIPDHIPDAGAFKVSAAFYPVQINVKETR
jgi:hypothetical protein